MVSRETRSTRSKLSAMLPTDTSPFPPKKSIATVNVIGRMIRPGAFEMPAIEIAALCGMNYIDYVSTLAEGGNGIAYLTDKETNQLVSSHRLGDTNTYNNRFLSSKESFLTALDQRVGLANADASPYEVRTNIVKPLGVTVVWGCISLSRQLQYERAELRENSGYPRVELPAFALARLMVIDSVDPGFVGVVADTARPLMPLNVTLGPLDLCEVPDLNALSA
jgi:hypothetical protein